MNYNLERMEYDVYLASILELRFLWVLIEATQYQATEAQLVSAFPDSLCGNLREVILCRK